FCVMAAVQIRGSVKRRAAGLNTSIEQLEQPRSLRHSSFRLAQRLLEQATKHYSSSNEDDTKVLRSRLIKAGFYDPRAVGYFFVGRTAFAVGLAAAVYFFAPVSEHSVIHWLLMIIGGIVGYVGPSMYVDRRIKVHRMEHQAGFPDFMDLLVV